MGGPLLPSQTRAVSALSVAAHSWPVTGFLLPPPSLRGEADVSATCLAAGHPSLSFSKSLMSTPTFCHPFLLTKETDPELLPFLFPKRPLLLYSRTHPYPGAVLLNCSTSGFSSHLAQARLAAPPTGELKEGGKKFGNYSRGYSLAIVKVLYTGLLKSNFKSNKRVCCKDHTHAPAR